MKTVRRYPRTLRSAAEPFLDALRPPAKGRRTAPGHHHMTALRWGGVIVSWALLFSAVALVVWLVMLILG